MTVTLNWKFFNFWTIPQQGELTQVLSKVEYVIEAVSPDGYSALNTGIVNFGAGDPANFVPYDQITHQQLIDWSTANLNMNKIMSQLSAVIESQRSPKQEPTAPPLASQVQ